MNIRTCPLTHWTSKWRRYASMFMWLIWIISTIISSITDISLKDTLSIFAFEEVIRACYGTTFLLIRMIIAVIRSITMPCNRNANSRCLTAEVFLLITLIWLNRWTSKLVRSIITVRDSVAFVILLYTLPKVCTLELISRACYWRTVFFILFIKAVIIAWKFIFLLVKCSILKKVPMTYHHKPTIEEYNVPSEDT